MKDTMYICGNIAVLAGALRWKDIETLIDQTKVDAMKAGMRTAASFIIPDGNPEVALHKILAAAEKLTEPDL